MLSRRLVAAAGAVLLACGCGAASANLPAPQVDVGPRLVVLTTEDGEVCATSTAVPSSASPACVPVVGSGEPVESATLARLDATAEVVMVLARADVVVRGLGAGTARAIVRANGRDMHVWLRVLPAGTEAICAAYRAPEGDGRLVVHRAITLASAAAPAEAEAVAVEAEPDDGC